MSSCKKEIKAGNLVKTKRAFIGLPVDTIGFVERVDYVDYGEGGDPRQLCSIQFLPVSKRRKAKILSYDLELFS